MSTVTVTVVRDAESPEWWLAHFTFRGESYTTQGAIVDEARFMAADLLRLLGAGDDCLIEFVLQDRETLSAVLARPVTPSLIAEEEVEKPFAVTKS
jgi:hypothetical protein